MGWFDDIVDFVEDVGQSAIDIVTDPVEETVSSATALLSGDFDWDWSRAFGGSGVGQLFGGGTSIGLANTIGGLAYGAVPKAAGASGSGSGAAAEGGAYPGFGGMPGFNYGALQSLLTSSPEMPEVPATPTLVDAAENAQLLLRDLGDGRQSTLLTGGLGSPGTTQRRALSAQEKPVNVGDTLGRAPLTSLLG